MHSFQNCGIKVGDERMVLLFCGFRPVNGSMMLPLGTADFHESSILPDGPLDSD